MKHCSMPEASTVRFLIALLILGGVSFSSNAQEPRACRSVHLWWSPKNTPPIDSAGSLQAAAFYNEVTVEKSSPGTYFSVCGFSKGYFGIQELANGKKIALFSVWEPGKQNNPNLTPEERRVKTISSGEGVRVKRFGGEGTGGQSFYDLTWKVGETVRFAVFAKRSGEHRTLYAGYVYLQEEARWQHMATFSTLADGHLLQGYYSFVEDFLRNGESARIDRRANFGNGWILLPKNDQAAWYPLGKARFTADNTQTNNINSGIAEDRVFLATGGDVKNDDTVLRQSNKLPVVDRKPPLDLPNPFDHPQLSGTKLRVLAYNIKHGRGNDGQVDLERIARVIRRLNPDVVALQEVDRVVERSGHVDETAKLAELTGLQYAAFGSFFDYQGGQYGMAIISRHPLSDVKNLRLPDGAEPRTSLVATVRTASPFRLANVHFYRTESERLAQANKLLEYLRQSKLPCIVAGDFNSQPNTKVLEQFSEFKIPDKGDDHFTFSSDRPRVEIDFIMHHPRDHFQLQEIDVIDEPVASDHRPVSADYVLPSSLPQQRREP